MTHDATMIDSNQVDAFAEKVVGILNGGALSMMLSIGHRTGLFDVMAGLGGGACSSIAAAAELDERYVREWLGAMVTGEIVDYDETTDVYRLPPEHAALLTRAASPNNLAVPAQFVSVLGGVEDRIVECFTTGGGVSYDEYPRFHEVMAEESGQTVVAALLDTILPLVPGLTEKLETGIDVLDVGCGSGRAMIALARRFPNSRFVGYDFSDESLAAARTEVDRVGLRNVCFEKHDVSRLPDDVAFDLVTAFDAIHDQAKPADVLREIHRVLRPGATFLMQDILGSSHVHGNRDHALAPFLYTISCMHCMTVSLAQGGAGLGAMWGRELAEKMLRDAGFATVTVEKLEHDDMNYFYVAGKSE